jgi:4-carboxymuconolactone decarboxylase
MNARFEKGIKQLDQLGEGSAQKVLDLFSNGYEDFAQKLIENFGDIFSRPHLNIQEREMITIASITTLGFAPDRLKTHIKGALNVGVSPQAIIEIIMQMATYAGFPAAVNAMLIAKEIFLERKINLKQTNQGV